MSSRVRPATGVALGALVAALISSLVLDGDAARPGSWWGVVAAVAVVVAIAVLVAAGAATRRAWLLVALLALIPTVATGWWWVVDLNTGTPGALLVLLTLCGLVVAGAAASGIVRPSPAGPVGRGVETDTDAAPSSVAERPSPRGTSHLRPGTRAIAASVTATALLLGVGLLLAPVATSAAVHSRIAEPVVVPNVPQLPTGPGWQSDTARARNFLNGGGVVAAGSGFVTALGYAGAPAPGLAGVHGTTGELRWTYDLSGATPSALAASPDGAYVIAVFVPRTEQVAQANRLVVLDALTGEPLWSRVVNREFNNAQLAPTNTVLPVFEADLQPAGERRNLLGFDLATGDVRWTADPPEGCVWTFTISHSTATASLQSQQCEDNTARLVALDQQSGIQQWTYTTDITDLTDGPVADNWGFTDLISTDPAGTVVKLVRDISGVDAPIVVVLAADGSVAATIDRGYPVTRGPLVMIEGSGTVLLPGVPEPLKITALGSECRNNSTVTTDIAVIGTCRQDGAATGSWQMHIQSVDPLADPVSIGDLPGPAEQIIVAPGAVISVVYVGDQIRYQAFH